MKIRWISHAAMQVITESGTVIYFDPYQLCLNLERADIVLCSHDHHDHLSEDDIALIGDSGTVVIVPNSVHFDGPYHIKKIDVGETVSVMDISVTAVPAYTEKLHTHPKENRWVGYILEAEGKRLYHGGDTGKMEEMAQFKNIDVAFLPVGGTYTMGFEEAMESAVLINPKIVVPMHNWDKNMVPFKEMVEKKVTGISVEILTDKILEL